MRGEGLGPPSISTALYHLPSLITCVTALMILAAAELFINAYHLLCYVLLYYFA